MQEIQQQEKQETLKRFFEKEEKAEIRRTRLRQAILIFLDLVSLIVSYLSGVWIRFEFRAGSIPPEHVQGVLVMLAFVIPITFILYLIFRLYRGIWIYASIAELTNIIIAYMILAPVLVLINYVGYQKIPWSSLFIAYILSGFFCILIRFIYRLLRFFFFFHGFNRISEDMIPVMIVGAGHAANSLLRDMFVNRSTNRYAVVIVDDDVKKKGMYLEGICIEGNRYDIPMLVEKYHVQEIIYAISSASSADRREILNICKDTGCDVKTVPDVRHVIDGTVRFSSVRKVNTLDLLGRDEIKVDRSEITGYLRGRTVLVTGGGGSIGSELCRQIAAAKPKQLIIFDIFENNAYEIQQELLRTRPDIDVVTAIGSVRNTNRVNSLLDKYKPQIIFHAAAHKHVPLMEDSPNEAVKNNVMGTWKLARAACRYGTERFVLISTDKAVNPTNIMGASKRICEMIIQTMDKECPNTVFSAVRFGNVLGSNGSVIPLFQKQIAAGGPVTVTDPNIIRYFMTIPEAVSLVLQAGCYAKGGEIFVLDMGDPVRIDDMARKLIRMSGYEPDVDIKIEYTGLRPGEKLFEELLMAEEGLTKTANEKIFIGKPIEVDGKLLKEQLDKLDVASRSESENIKELVAEIVPTYHPAP